VDRLTDLGEGSDLNGDLRYCITQAQDGDRITFGVQGSITLTSGELPITKDLNIEGPGADILTVSGNHASRVFNIAATPNVTISGLMITNGQAPSNQNGGGINNAGTLTITDSIINGNSAATGGGIQNAGTLTVTNSSVNGNTAAVFSAGINNDGRLTINGTTLDHNNASAGGALGNSNSGTITITDSTLDDNLGGGMGGGIRNFGGTVTVLRSIFTGNYTPGGNGGGIDNEGMMSLTDSTLTGSSSEGGGGGILNGAFNGGAMLLITRSTLNDNSAASGGGGIANWATLIVTDSTLSGNSASFGAGITNYNGSSIVTFSTLSGNHGGGINLFRGQITARNTILAANTGGSSPDINGPLNSQGHNLIGDGTGGSGFTDTDLVGTADNPIDPLLGPLQDNGGPTWTMALLPGSPAIDAGDNTDAPDWDQRGEGFRRIVNGIIDIGAFEVQVNAPAGGSSGVPFHVTMTALNAYRHVASGYTFTADDGGVHTFADGVTLITPGDQILTVQDTVDDTITGSATITVNGTSPGRNTRHNHNAASLNALTLDRLFASNDSGRWDAWVGAALVSQAKRPA
jgi:hypothetical protein